jgi:hypothetical protein
MALSEDQKIERRKITLGAATAFVEDIEHIREVSRKLESSRGEIRRLSAVVRRLLIDGDLSVIAAPRIGKFTLRAPNRKDFYAIEKRARILFFASGGAPFYGVTFQGILLANAGPAKGNPEDQARQTLGHLAPTSSQIDLKLANFLSQRVLCYMGNWVSRKEAIKYIANVYSGVHSRGPSDLSEENIAKLFDACTYSAVDGKLKVHVLKELGADSAPIEYSAATPIPMTFPTDVLNPVLLEVLAAAMMVATSPDVLGLEKVIREELTSCT